MLLTATSEHFFHLIPAQLKKHTSKGEKNVSKLNKNKNWHYVSSFKFAWRIFHAYML